MQFSRSNGRTGCWRTRFAYILVLGALPLLGGCLPGLQWGGDEGDDRSSLAESSESAPALDRSNKTSFFSLKMPSFGSSSDDRPSTASAAFSTVAIVEARKSFQPDGFVTSTEAPVFEPVPLPAAQALASAYSALAALQTGKLSRPLSIVHLDGDRITDDRFAGPLREHLIGRFGNAGRGLMQPGIYPIRGMRIDRGGKWSLESAAGEAQGPFGVSGARVTSLESDAWLRFTATEGPFQWVDATFMTGPYQGTAAVTVDGEVKLVPTKSASTSQTSIRISAKGREITIRPRGDGAITLLSVASGTGAPGVLYSNAGLPGATASSMDKWDAGFVANDLRKLNPDLILIGYGTKEGFADDLDVRQYEERLRDAIRKIKTSAPQASILIVGPPDAARLPSFAGSSGAQVCRALNPQEAAAYSQMLRRGDERLARWHAPPRLEAVRAAMRRVAAASGAYYWDWAKSMGGPCSIHAWTTSKPPLAALDHTTLTEAGEDKGARALFTELMAGFDAYQRAQLAKAQTAAAVYAPPPAPVKPTKVSTKKQR
jgi:hypothetical protein